MVYRLVDIHFHGLACSGHAIHPSQRSRVLTSAPITLEENVWLGANVTVVGGVTIGAGSVGVVNLIRIYLLGMFQM